MKTMEAAESRSVVPQAAPQAVPETPPETAAEAASGISAFAARVNALDLAFYRRLAGLHLPTPLLKGLIFLVRVGDGWIWGLIAAALWYALPFPEVKRVVLHCALAIGISLSIYLPVKFLGRRRRPYDNGWDVTPLVPPLDKYSFPSGHTMNNLAVALTLASHLHALLIPALLVPLLLGTLRVRFGVHYLSDILGGGLLGGAAFFLARALFPAFPF